VIRKGEGLDRHRIEDQAFGLGGGQEGLEAVVARPEARGQQIGAAAVGPTDGHDHAVEPQFDIEMGVWILSVKGPALDPVAGDRLDNCFHAAFPEQEGPPWGAARRAPPQHRVVGPDPEALVQHHGRE